MRFGLRRGVMLAFALAAALAAPRAASAQWGSALHVIPRETVAIDYRTGGVAMAPPIPYGEYAKDYVGCLTGPIHGCLGKICGLCRGVGCGFCHNKGWGNACGQCGGNGCGACDGSGVGHAHGLFHHGRGGGSALCGDPACGGGGHGGGGHGGGGLFGHRGGKHLGHHGAGYGEVLPSAQGTVASPQAPVVLPSAQCGGCGGKGCGLCRGGGLGHHGGGLGHHGGGLCGDPGCGPCGKHRAGKLCGDPGCGLCGKGHGDGLCKHCGGRGCALCGRLLGGVHTALAKYVGIGGVKYFVGPGGPVPITPGYVNYVVPVRSPRDFFAFPPFVDIDP